MCNAANAIFALVPRLTGTPVALNVDGIERLRKKWGPAGRAYYRLSEYLATIIPNVMVTDAEVIRDYYLKEYRNAVRHDCLRRRLRPRRNHGSSRPAWSAATKYFLYVSRLEPENNAHVVIKAFEQVATDKPLLIVGDAPYAQEYIEQLKATRRSAHSLSRSDLWAGLPRVAVACLRVYSSHRSWRHTSRTD